MDQKPTLYEYYINCNQFFLFLESSTLLLKLFKLIGLFGLIVQLHKLLTTSIFFYKEFTDTHDSPFNEHANRALFNLFTTIDQIFIFNDWFNFDPFTFCKQFDHLWSVLPFSVSSRRLIDLELAKRRYSFLLITAANLILCYVLLFHDPLIITKKVSHGTYLMKVISVLGYCYSCLIVLHLMVSCVFLHSGLNCLSDILDSLVYQSKVSKKRKMVRKTEDNDDDDNGQRFLRAKTILYYRNVYQQLGQLIELTDSSHRLFIGTFYLSCVPKFVTIVYDIAFTEAVFKVFHITEACVNLIRLFVITNSVATISSYISSFWKAIYRLTTVCPTNSALIEANLFLERINQQSYGIKIFNQKLITPAIVPTMITAIITYFITICSINQGSIVTAEDDDDDFDGDDD